MRNNMKINMVQGIIIGILLTILSSCNNPFELPNNKKNINDQGSFMLMINETNVERTIMPSITKNDFALYTLEFFESGTNTEPIFVQDRTNGNLTDPILLNAGVWDLRVCAYMDTDKSYIIARGFLPDIAITGGETVARNVILEPATIYSGSNGTFTWNIDFYETLKVINAEITITPLDTESDTPAQTIIHNTVLSAEIPWTGMLNLNTGYYRVVITLRNDRGRRTGLRDTLHIYKDMDSVLNLTFTESQFSNIISYNVSYDANGGEPVPESPIIIDHGDILIEPAVMTKDDYVFGGWFTEEDCINQWDFEIDIVIDNLTLYALWLPTFSVSFEANGGFPEPVQQIITQGFTINEPEEMVKTGYTFVGWFTEDEEEWDYNIDVVTDDLTLHANWDAITYTIVYNKNASDAIGTTLSSSHTYDIEKELTTNDYTRPGYAFTCWNDYEKDISYTDEQNVVNLSDTAGDIIILYAQWDITCTITFNANGGTPAPIPQVIDLDEKVTEPPAMTNGVYTFGGWYRDSTFNTKFNFDTEIVNSNITLYAKWGYIVAFSANGGSPAPDQQVVPIGNKVSEPGTMTRSGYTFCGWYKDTAFTTEWDFDIDIVMTNTPLYAKWGFTVDFIANSGSPVPSQQIIINGDKVIEPAVMTRSGYTFDDWYKESTFDNKWNFTIDLVTGNTILYAHWIPNQIVISIEFEQITEYAPIIVGGDIFRSSIDLPRTLLLNISNYSSYSSVKWSIDGVGVYTGTSITGSAASFTIDAEDIRYNTLGSHIVYLQVVKDGIPYSTTIKFTIKE